MALTSLRNFFSTKVRPLRTATSTAGAGSAARTSPTATGTQAQRLEEAVRSNRQADGSPIVEVEAGDAGRAPTSPPAKARTKSLAELSRGYDDVVQMVRKINEHLDRQADRTEQLTRLLDRAPDVLETLPRLEQQTSQLVEALTSHLEGSRQRDASLNTTLQQIHETTTQHTQMLGLFQQQLDRSSGAAEQMNQTLGSLRQALGELAKSNERSASVLSEMADAAQQRESQLVRSLDRTQRWMIVAMICCGAASAIAAVAAALALAG